MQIYKEVQDDLPDRIMRMAEASSETERRLRERNQIFQLIDSLARRLIALIAFMFAIGVSFFLIKWGHDWAGTTLATATVIGVVVALVKKDGDGKTE